MMADEELDHEALGNLVRFFELLIEIEKEAEINTQNTSTEIN